MTAVMRTLATLTLAVLVALPFASCGCDCNKPNMDYLRDVPVTRSQRFQ